MQRLFPLLGVVGALVLSTSARADDAYEFRLAPTWRVEYHNDVFFRSDNKFTSGLSAQRHSNLALDWHELDVPEWVKFGRRLPGLGAAGLYRRISLAFGQNIQTPDDLSAPELLVDDVPYAGFMGADISLIAFDDDRLRGYGFTVGAVGPSSGGEQVQKFFHALVSDVEPRGWDNQLPNELVVNFNGIFKRKIGSVGSEGRWSADFAASGGFGLGTGLQLGEVGLEARWGINLPRGFAYFPTPIGRGVNYDASLVPGAGAKRFLYFSLAARVVAISHSIFLDGSLWRQTPSVARRNSVNQLVFGIHLQGPKWVLHATMLTASVLAISPAPDPRDEFGTIAIEWKR